MAGLLPDDCPLGVGSWAPLGVLLATRAHSPTGGGVLKARLGFKTSEGFQNIIVRLLPETWR